MHDSGWLKAEALQGKYPVVFVWFPLALLLAFIGASLWFSFTQHIAQAEKQALTIVRAVEQHATATVDRANLSLLAVIQRLRADDLNGDSLSSERRRQLTGILIDQHRQTRGVVSMSLTDADGIVLANSVGTAPGVDLGQRRYFRQLKSGPPGSIAISEVVKGKVSNKWGLQVARRIDLPDGRFGGMLVANLGLYENFESFYETLDVGPQGLITLRSQDNTVLVRFPVVESALGRIIEGSEGTRAVSEQVVEKVVRSVSPIDRVDRITTVRRLADYPVYASVGIAFQTVLLSWLKESAPMLVLSLGILLLMALMSMMVQRRFALLQELKALSARLDTANKELLDTNALIEKQSLQDQLTGAWNRRFADLRLREAIAKSEREDMPFSLLMCDLDHFKAINDHWGHPVGDSVLVEFVGLVQARLRINDILIRWGGEEFLLLLEGSDSNAAAMLAEQLRAAVEAYDFPSVGKLTVTIGVAQYQPGEPLHELIHRVDTALYDAKHAGRNQIRQSKPQPAHSV